MIASVSHIQGMDEAHALYEALRAAMQHNFANAVEMAEKAFRPDPSFQFDKVAIFHLWLSHLLGRAPAPVVVDFARELTPDDSVYAMSAHVAAAMSSATSSSDAARELVAAADAMLTGRLQLEEAEFLVAFARLAQLDGDTERARSLTSMVAARAPWTWLVMGEILGDLEHWPEDEWGDRTRVEILLRSSPDRVAELRDQAPGVLAEELDRWRAVL
jgi:hypothetical protein